MPGKIPLSNHASVRLERDPEIDALLPRSRPEDDDDNSKSVCFGCGRSGLRNSGDEQFVQREEKKFFKNLLVTPEHLESMSSEVYKQFRKNFASCPICSITIEKIWTLHKKLISIQQEMDDIMIFARDNFRTTENIPPKKKSANIGTIKKALPSRETRSLEANFDESIADDEHNQELEEEMKEELSDDETVKPKIKIPQRGRPKHGSNLKISQNLSKKCTIRSLVSVRARPVNGFKKVNHKCTAQSKLNTKSKRVNSEARVKKGKDITRNKNTPDEKRLNCGKCGKVLSTWKNRIMHEILKCKIHYDKSYLERMKISLQKCSICDKFISNLDRHMLYHKGITPYPCPKCGTRFTQKSGLTRHCKREQCSRKPRKSKLFQQAEKQRRNIDGE